jgi:Zn-dependent M28 family amino/carboxypeptidase
VSSVRAALTTLLALPLLASAAPDPDRAARWWSDIAIIADDATEGRQVGSPGYMLAADHVVKRFKEIGLAPAGDDGGFLQQVAFEEQLVDAKASTVSLVGADGQASPLTVGSDVLISAGGGPRPAIVDAPLVFVGYGLSLPGKGHDDFAGLDMKGKIAVVIGGGPAGLPGPVKASNRSDRARLLGEAGAIGLITLTPQKQIEIPWERQKLLSPAPGMYLADAELRLTPDDFFTASINPAESERLFVGTGHSFADLSALADASKPVPTFALPFRLKASITARKRQLTSPNLVARLEGSDPKLKNEFVVFSAHLDHIGIGAPINGDAIYNGAMDDASGVASVLDIAAVLKTGKRPKRSILFVIVTAEEKGLLGSHYFAQKPTVPKGTLVADLNFDMPLPFWKLTSVLAQGDRESSLGDVARGVATRQGLRLVPDPLPDRNSFTRTDQFSFVRAGIPALAFKFGFEKGTPEFEIEHNWRATRYHAPSDDVDQPGVLKEEAIRLHDFVAAIAIEIANAPKRPEWLETSVFKPAAAR